MVALARNAPLISREISTQVSVSQSGVFFEVVHLRVPPNNLVLEVTKASVTQVTTTEEEVKVK